MTDALQAHLEVMLRGLADLAPQGPSAASVTARLARRTLIRVVGVALCLILVAVLAAIGVWKFGTVTERAPANPASMPKPRHVPIAPAMPPVTPRPEPEPPQVLKPRVESLGTEADHVELGEALSAYFAARGVSRALIMKDGADQLSFSLNTRDDESLAQIRADIESLLGNYDRAEITLRNGRLSYALLASGRP